MDFSRIVFPFVGNVEKLQKHDLYNTYLFQFIKGNLILYHIFMFFDNSYVYNC